MNSNCNEFDYTHNILEDFIVNWHTQDNVISVEQLPP